MANSDLCVAQHMERDCRGNLGGLARVRQGPVLMAGAPFGSAIVCEDQRTAVAAGRRGFEERSRFVRQHNVARLAALAGPHRQHARAGVKVGAPHCGKFPVSATGQQGRPHHRPKFSAGGVHKPSLEVAICAARARAGSCR